MPGEGVVAHLRRWLATLARHAAEAGQRRAQSRFGPQQHAVERSRKLLVACLSAAQRAEFERTLGFCVHGASGRRYRIGYSTTANVEVLGEDGEVLFRLCAGPNRLPTPSVLLAQKLMLEACEAEFLRIAARHPPVMVSFASRRGTVYAARQRLVVGGTQIAERGA
jgi:hypothetical protein